MQETAEKKFQHLRQRLVSIATLVIGIIFLAQFFGSFAWRQYLDTPLLNYVGFLINEHGLVPYQEIFETSMPGAFLFHSLFGMVMGYSDLAVRIADSLFLLLSMLLIFLIIKPFSKQQATFAAFLAGLVYLSFGAKMALQRDFLGLIPVLAAILLINRKKQFNGQVFWIQLIAGCFIGISSSFKPHQAIILPFLAYFSIEPDKASKMKPLMKVMAICISGFLLTFSIPLIWVWQKGGLTSFLEIFFNYLPLHTQIGHDFGVVMWPEKFWYSLSGLFLLNDNLILLLLGISGFYLGKPAVKDEDLPAFKLLVIASAVFFLYTAITGQFWYYHWIPFLFFACVGASFLLSSYENDRGSKTLIPVLVLFLVIPLQVSLSNEFKRQISGQELEKPLDGVPDQISSFLQKNLKPGDRVQSLDWVNGAIHGMLEAKALTATPFLYDYHFYHHVSQPFIQELRKRFINALNANPPDYFIYVFLKSRVTGPDTTQEFPELGKFLFANYVLVLKDERFGIFRKITKQ